LCSIRTDERRWTSAGMHFMRAVGYTFWTVKEMNKL
jgi:hypothetical protein